MHKILIVEDDFWISESLKLYLENSSYQVELYHSWEWVIEQIKKHIPELIILDVNLPWKSWFEVCKDVREFSKIPIIMLTARTAEGDTIKWFESGADDYIGKPFSPRELLARIQSIFRRHKETPLEPQNDLNSTEEWVLKYKNIEIHTNKYLVKVSWKEVALTKNEFDIFRKIVQENWKIVSRETIMKEIIWYSDYRFDRTIDTHIKNIRRKVWLKDCIVTIRSEWYRLNK
jgi:two-component system response regulator BaeR